MGHPDTLPFEVSTQIVQLRGTSDGREDLYPEYSPDSHISIRSDRPRNWCNEDSSNAR